MGNQFITPFLWYAIMHPYPIVNGGLFKTMLMSDMDE